MEKSSESSGVEERRSLSRSSSLEQMLKAQEKMEQVEPIQMNAWKSKPELQSMKQMLHSVNGLTNRDIVAYMSRVSWPKKLKENPYPCSESYLDPHISSNGHILDSQE